MLMSSFVFKTAKPLQGNRKIASRDLCPMSFEGKHCLAGGRLDAFWC